jgi:hypothetical protein
MRSFTDSELITAALMLSVSCAAGCPISAAAQAGNVAPPVRLIAESRLARAEAGIVPPSANYEQVQRRLAGMEHVGCEQRYNPRIAS